MDEVSGEASPGPNRRRLPRSTYLAGIALLLLALVWGYSWVVAKVGVGQTQPFTFAALRNLSAALLLLLVAAVMRRPIRPKALGWLVLLGLLQTTGMVGFAMWALEEGGAGKTSVLVYTMPFWLLLMAWIVLGEQIRGVQWVAVTCALAGLVALLSPWRLDGVMSSALAVASGLCWAASAVVVKLMRNRHSFDLLSLTGWQMLFGAIPLVLIAALTFREAPEWSGSFVAALSYQIVLSEALGWFLWLYVLKTLPASTAGVAVLATPVVAAVAAWAQLGERPGTSEAIGMGLIGLALLLVTVQALRRRRGEQPEASQSEFRHATGRQADPERG